MTNETLKAQDNAMVMGQDLGQTEPIIAAHERVRRHENVAAPINGVVSDKNWKVISPVDEIITSRSGPRDMAELDYFKWMFPITFLLAIFIRSNMKLHW